MKKPLPKNAPQTIDILNRILEHELAGVVRYIHYSLMAFGPNRIPIVQWLRSQATESLNHAAQAGEHVTSLGGHPSLKIASLLETQKHSTGDILRESLEHESSQLSLYYDLLKLVDSNSVGLEEFARHQIECEEKHISEVEKMLRPVGTISASADKEKKGDLLWDQ